MDLTLKRDRLKNDGIETHTSEMQADCEDECNTYLVPLSSLPEPVKRDLRRVGLLSSSDHISLIRDKHASYLVGGMRYLSGGWSSLDASRPWLCYWTLHSLALLSRVPDDIPSRVVHSLQRCQHPSGGFGGGFMQIPHCAPTFAAVGALLTSGLVEGYQTINRRGLYKFLLSMKQGNGGFTMHEGGEEDVRATYAALAAAAMTNILTPELAAGAKEYLLSAQTCEGGFGGEPGNEAHGGYAFCAFAALLILGEAHHVDIDLLEYWLVNRQMAFEGGFQGRTNKLVDGCYSYWQGAIPAMIALHKSKLVDSAGYSLGCRIRADAKVKASVSYEYLQSYILNCCQVVEGGLRDKPSKNRDYYHTCYCLSGLSIAQNFATDEPFVVGDTGNLLAKCDPIFNVRSDLLERATDYFKGLECTHDALMSM